MLQIYKNKANNSLYYILLTIRPPFFNTENQKTCDTKCRPVKNTHVFAFLQILDYQSDAFLLSFQSHQNRPFYSVFRSSSGSEVTAFKAMTAGNERRKRRMEATKAPFSRNKSNGIVERIHWNR